jgi:hypothetical protein
MPRRPPRYVRARAVPAKTPVVDPRLVSEARDALIVYEGLPLPDGGAHELGRRDPVAVWRRLAAFLETFAVVDESAATVSLQEMGWHSTRASRRVRAELTAVFGRPRRSAVGWGDGRLRDSHWAADPQRVEETLRRLSRVERLPDVYRTPALVLAYEARFRLCDPATGTPFPHQGGRFYGGQDLDGRGLVGLGESRLFTRLSRRPTCNLVLSFPFRDVTDRLLEYVAELQRGLPFELSADHWTRWWLDEGRTAYVPIELEGLVDEREGVEERGSRRRKGRVRRVRRDPRADAADGRRSTGGEDGSARR